MSAAALPSPVEAALAAPGKPETEGLTGWVIWSLGEWVARCVAAHPGELHRGLQCLHALTQRFSAPYGGDEWSAYLALSAANKAPFSAFVRLPHSAMLSLSPERFLLLDGRHIETKPIKGTRPRHPDPAQDARVAEALASADKDRSENLMIVDLRRNDIGRVSRPGSVTVPHLFAVESFPAVHHLVSTIHSFYQIAAFLAY